MFIRQVKKKNSKKGKVFHQYQLVQASRVDGVVKQSIILYLGSDKPLEDKMVRKEVAEQLQSKVYGQGSLHGGHSRLSQQLAEEYYQKYLLKYGGNAAGSKFVIPNTAVRSNFQPVDTENLDVENSRTFGAENLCQQTCTKLDLEQCFKGLGFSPGDVKLAQISIISKAIFTSSEYRTSQYLEDNSSLKDLFLMGKVKITHQNLYKISDKLYQNKGEIDRFMYNKILNLFDLDDTMVIYDLSNTHFEGRKANSKIAKYGKNKQKRNDCKQVVFTGIINSAGFIRHSRVYEGNQADIATIEDMIKDLEAHNPNTRGMTVVTDAGFASEENLRFLNGKGYNYVCVARQTPKGERAGKPKAATTTVEDRLGNRIELSVFNPQGHHDTWMHIKSEQKRVKEESITIKLCDRFEKEIQSIANSLHKKGGTKNTDRVWERIGRCKEKNRVVSGRYIVEVTEQNGKATEIKWQKKERKEVSDNKHGVYYIRTNIQGPTEKMLWDTYNVVREVEASFKCLKSDLNIRPVHHQNDDRVESHIYLTILAYQLVNCIRYMLKEKGINHSWTNIVRIMNTQALQDVVIPMETKTLKITTSSKPNEKSLEIYKATNTNSRIATRKKYVVYH